ncbi:hypothetical protein [Nitratireductor luteus]|uniref:hypothetical protein n=1 Tax=Nitratireductor luteus TaxID=2976980 RepID=UPI00224060D5|nr:hypothetical protein [Nitratireductor luteus]
MRHRDRNSAPRTRFPLVRDADAPNPNFARMPRGPAGDADRLAQVAVEGHEPGPQAALRRLSFSGVRGALAELLP